MEDILLGGLLALSGTVLGALASFFGPLIASSAAAKRDKETARLTERGRLLGLFIHNLHAAAEYPVPFTEAKPRRAASAMTQAQMALSLVLTVDEQDALDYMNGLVGLIASYGADVMRRRGAMEHGGQELIDWHRGSEKADLRPFDFVEYSQSGQLMIRRLDKWPPLVIVR